MIFGMLVLKRMRVDGGFMKVDGWESSASNGCFLRRMRGAVVLRSKMGTDGFKKGRGVRLLLG